MRGAYCKEGDLIERAFVKYTNRTKVKVLITYMKGIQPYGDRKNLNKKRDFSPVLVQL